ncbi:MAG: TonB-dependent receptor plug domain-containing protein, partial [Deltaproteobacteria bacterium]|nr:TonB-dependent receptor plug domain-containing protein [Deltaproteobacteria bacterium]
MRTVAAALCSLVAAWGAPAAGAPAAGAADAAPTAERPPEDGPPDSDAADRDAANPDPGDRAPADPDPADAVVVEDTGGTSVAPSARRWDAAALARAPGRSADELLRLVPGLHASAHGGRGKGFQYFMRGHDALHGGDLAVRLEGVPLNEPSNVHGHGYLDLHFIPEPLLAGMAAAPGASRAEVGDFAVAGSVDLTLGAATPGPGARARGGTDRSGGLSLWAGQPGGAGFAAAEIDAGQGVGEARSWRLARAGAGGARPLPGGGALRGWALAGAQRFESPGTLREDDVLSGRMAWTEAYPGSGGGEGLRALGALSAEGRRGSATGGAQLWGGLRRLRLDQNFTGYLRAPLRGDGTRQTHAATSLGVRTMGGAQLGPRARVEGGTDARFDQIHQATQGLGAGGAVWGAPLERAGQVLDGAVYAQGRWAPAPPLLLRPGLRAEGLALQAEPDALDPDGAAQTAGALLPKLEVAAWPDRPVSAGLAAGRGLRSPALEGLGIGDRATIALVDTGELGLRWRPGPG